MDKLKLLWLEPKVEFNGKGIITAWGEEMARQGWEIFTEEESWQEADLIFFGSDSQLINREYLLGKKPTLCYFWGWWPGRFLEDDEEFRQHAGHQLQSMSRCTRVLVPSWSTLEQAAGYGLYTQLCLPGIDTEPLNYGPMQASIGAEMIWMSRMVPHKNLDLVIDALGMLEPGSVKLTVCGPGNIEPYAERARDLGLNVRFCQPNDYQKSEMIKNSRFLIHSSTYEGFGLPPLEALYCGVPVISIDTPHNRWVLQEDVEYFWTTEGLASILHDALAGCDDHGYCPNYGRHELKAAKGKQRVRSTFTLKDASERLWAHIHQTIKEHLGWELRECPTEWGRIYDAEHRRNWAYSIDRFDPTWARHWRAQMFVEKLEANGAQRILDVGCGAVYPTIFARAGFDVVALDISVECLDQVVEVAKKWEVSGKVSTINGDATDMIGTLELYPGREPPFDAVILGEILEHVPEPLKVLDQALRAVKIGGTVIATTPIGIHHYDPMHLTVWDDQTITALAESRPDAALMELGTVAEQGCDPSCYLFVLKKLQETKQAEDDDRDDSDRWDSPGID